MQPAFKQLCSSWSTKLCLWLTYRACSGKLLELVIPNFFKVIFPLFYVCWICQNLFRCHLMTFLSSFTNYDVCHAFCKYEAENCLAVIWGSYWSQFPPCAIDHIMSPRTGAWCIFLYFRKKVQEKSSIIKKYLKFEEHNCDMFKR